MLVLIDNYDSFVHNLARYCNELGCETRVLRNDEMSADDVFALQPGAILISPGPCGPTEAGISEMLVAKAVGVVPVLGVCLGHQAIASAAGGRVVRADRPVHGHTAEILHDESALFVGLPNPLRVMRYHSLLVDETTLGDDYIVTSRTADGIVMSIQHRTEAVFGVQFHPESILTFGGHRLLANFLRVAGIKTSFPAGTELVCQIDRGLWDQPFEFGVEGSGREENAG